MSANRSRDGDEVGWHFESKEYEFAQICSRFVAVYLRLHLKICTLQTRYKKCSVQIDLLFYVFTH